jgi:hypothetical protein
MASSSPFVKGALIAMNPTRQDTIAFQYNPDALTRTITAQSTGGDNADKGEVLRLKGPPVETIKIDVEIDATDQLERGDGVAMSMGLHGTLAALELLLYPKSAQMIANEVLLAAGVIEIIPPEAPLTLFVWGPKRILPVRLNEFSITEEAFDANLNPIRAKVSLGMRVLTYQDLGLFSAGGARFMVHQIIKEALASI